MMYQSASSETSPECTVCPIHRECIKITSNSRKKMEGATAFGGLSFRRQNI